MHALLYCQLRSTYFVLLSRVFRSIPDCGSQLLARNSRVIGSWNFSCCVPLPSSNPVCQPWRSTLAGSLLLTCFTAKLRENTTPELFSSLALGHQFLISLANTYSKFHPLGFNFSLCKIRIHSENLLSTHYLPSTILGVGCMGGNKVICEHFTLRNKDRNLLEKPTAAWAAICRLGTGRAGWQQPVPRICTWNMQLATRR